MDLTFLRPALTLIFLGSSPTLQRTFSACPASQFRTKADSALSVLGPGPTRKPVDMLPTFHILCIRWALFR